jgi:hypothetical protein
MKASIEFSRRECQFVKATREGTLNSARWGLENVPRAGESDFGLHHR